jgi:hypothetical protein
MADTDEDRFVEFHIYVAVDDEGTYAACDDENNINAYAENLNPVRRVITLHMRVEKPVGMSAEVTLPAPGAGEATVTVREGGQS